MFRSRFDWYLFLPVFFLLGFGVAIVGSVATGNLVNHLLYIAVGFIFFGIFSFLDLEILLPFAPIIYLLNLGLLVLPFVFGTITRGSVRWIPIGGYTIQPSELVKPFLALLAAWYWKDREFSCRSLAIFFLLFLPALGLILLQPDLGSALVVLSIFATAVIIAVAKWRQLLPLVAIGLVTIPIFWFSLHDYQRARVTHFLNPSSDPLGKGYNLIQAKIAVGSGGVFGRGLGRGTQSHLAFLPERHTDFIFASLTEELGFIGGGLVLFFYLALFFRILKIASRLRERGLVFLVLGLLGYLFFQTSVNIGMNMGLMPITGVTLPLISYGGSSLLATLISLGILESASRRGSREGVIEIK